MQFDPNLATLIVSVIAMIVSSILTLYNMKLTNDSRRIQDKMAEFNEESLDITKKEVTEDRRTRTINILSNIVEVLENLCNSHLSYFASRGSFTSQKEIDGLKTSIAQLRRLFSLNQTNFLEYRQYLEILEKVLKHEDKIDAQKAIQITQDMIIEAKERIQNLG